MKSKDSSKHLSFNRKRRENCEGALMETLPHSAASHPKDFYELVSNIAKQLHASEVKGNIWENKEPLQTSKIQNTEHITGLKL